MVIPINILKMKKIYECYKNNIKIKDDLERFVVFI